MQTPRAVTLAVSVLILALVPFGLGQLATQSSPQRTLGYYDSETGAFQPIPQTPDQEAPPVTPTTGTLTFKFTIAMKTPLPKNAVLICSAGAAVIETSYSTTESAFGIATLSSGTTYACTATMHYSWLLNSPATDKVILSYKGQVLEGIQVTATNGTATTVITGGRSSSQTTASIPVPISGASTTETISVTL